MFPLKKILDRFKLLKQSKKDFKKGIKMILTQIFYNVDNFCKDFRKHLDALSISVGVSAVVLKKIAPECLSVIL
jgi:hypothetical protein